ncbi:helix-turn-helix domain-containing protein, partial [Escherichia coli]|nr:helix-turn-helix domain-containing protein [Escherichia coli]
MSVSDLSASTQDYLKAIWELEEWSDQPATTSMIAKALGVKQSTVSDTVRKLADQELVSHKRYG